MLKSNDKHLILTHHSPSFKTGQKAGKYVFKNGEKVKELFYSDLENFCLENHKSILYWCFGHTHIPFHNTIANVEMISNPMGYNPDYYSFHINKTIKL